MACNVVNRDSLDTVLVCALCKVPWLPETAVACPKCDVIFCRPCIEDHLAKNTTCPDCRSDVDVAAFLRPPRLLRSLAERTVIVRCPNRPDLCWSGPLGELESHLKDCPFDPAKVIYKDNVPDELHCSICLHVLNDPETTSCCEQAFCKACIRGALARKPECPHCREPHPEELLREPRPSLVGILGRLEVVCPARCSWSGPRVALEAHKVECNGAAVAAPAPTTAAPAPTATAPPAPSPAPVVTPAFALPSPPVATSTAETTPHIRLEAMNYHPTVHASDAVVSFTAMAHIVAPKPTTAQASNRKDLQISAVMDISGSMRGEKLRLAKEALSFVVNEMKECDRFGLIAFDDRVEEAMPLETMHELGRSRAHAAIRSLEARGSTNLSGGLFAGVAQARDLLFTPEVVAVPLPKKLDPRGMGIMSRMMQAVTGSGGGSSSTSRPSSATVPPPPVPSYLFAEGRTSAPPPNPDAAVGIPAFDVVVKVNASPFKLNQAWSTRFNFTATIPAHVPDRVAVRIRDAEGNVCNLRSGAATLTSKTSTFQVEVSAGTVVRAQYPWTIDVEQGVCEFRATYDGFRPEVPRQRSRIVLLFTDGQANCGITDASTLTARTKEILARMPDKDVTVFTFGFGDSHNGTLLQQLAEVSQGSYYFVKNNAQMVEVFADCIGGLLSMVATNLHLAIRPNLGVRIKTVMTQFPIEDGPSGSKIVRIKDLYAEEQRDVCVELDVAPRCCGAAAALVTFQLTCENVVLGRTETVTAVSLVPTVPEAFTGVPNVEVDQQIARHLAAVAMREAQELADAGRVADANARLVRMRDAMRLQSSCETEYHKSLSRDIEIAQKATMSASMWESQGQKEVNRMRNAHTQQRANTVDECDDGVYATAAKMAARAKCKK